MNLHLLRYSDNGDDTTGLLFIDGVFACYTIEDEHRNVKIAGETRIPEGEYEIGFREEESPMTEKYRKDYPDIFDYHLQLLEVPGFQFIYIHVGNTDEDTMGCILLNDSMNNNQIQKGRGGFSRNAFKRIYPKIWKALKTGEQVKIKIDTL